MPVIKQPKREVKSRKKRGTVSKKNVSKLDLLTQEMETYSKIYEAAFNDGKWQAATDAFKSASQIRREIEMVSAVEEAGKLPPLEEHAMELFQDARRLRIAATSSGSFVAAQNLIKQEYDMVAKKIDQEIASGKKQTLSVKDLLDMQNKLKQEEQLKLQELAATTKDANREKKL